MFQSTSISCPLGPIAEKVLPHRFQDYEDSTTETQRELLTVLVLVGLLQITKTCVVVSDRQIVEYAFQRSIAPKPKHTIYQTKDSVQSSTTYKCVEPPLNKILTLPSPRKKYIKLLKEPTLAMYSHIFTIYDPNSESKIWREILINLLVRIYTRFLQTQIHILEP